MTVPPDIAARSVDRRIVYIALLLAVLSVLHSWSLRSRIHEIEERVESYASHDLDRIEDLEAQVRALQARLGGEHR